MAMHKIFCCYSRKIWKNLIIFYCLSNFLAACQVNYDRQYLPVKFKFEIRALHSGDARAKAGKMGFNTGPQVCMVTAASLNQHSRSSLLKPVLSENPYMRVTDKNLGRTIISKNRVVGEFTVHKDMPWITNAPETLQMIESLAPDLYRPNV